MYVNRKWAYLNVFALTLNGLFWCLTAMKIAPALLILLSIAFILAVLVAASYKINKEALQAKRRSL
jgi:apolipoprotein N-acyltransferase